MDILILTFVFLFSLAIGSFLNVVIIRLPKILERQTTRAAYDILALAPPPKSQAKITMSEQFLPASHCPQCHQTLRWFHNIPVVSYVLLRGKCAFCHRAISGQYPVVELIGGVLVTFLIGYYGLNPVGIALSVLTWCLIVLSFIDWQHYLLPDILTLPFVWVGLLLNTFDVFTTPSSAIFGAVFGYLCLWFFYWIFKVLTKKEGFGYGDFKLLSVLGAWFGLQALPFIILASTITGIGLALIRGNKATQPIPFGPALALSGWLYPLVGIALTQWYWQSIH